MRTLAVGREEPEISRFPLGPVLRPVREEPEVRELGGWANSRKPPPTAGLIPTSGSGKKKSVCGGGTAWC